MGAFQNLFAHACSRQHSIWFNFPSTTCLFLLKLTQDVSALPAQFTLPLSYLLILLISWHILIGFPFSLVSGIPYNQTTPPKKQPEINQETTLVVEVVPTSPRLYSSNSVVPLEEVFIQASREIFLNPKTDLGIFTMDFGPQIKVKFGDHHKISKDEICI